MLSWQGCIGSSLAHHQRQLQSTSRVLQNPSPSTDSMPLPSCSTIFFLRTDFYGDLLRRLNVNQNDSFNQSLLSLPPSDMREITDGTWHRRAISRHVAGVDAAPVPDDLSDLLDHEEPQTDPLCRKFVVTLEEHKDSTGSDTKEAHSLEPVLASTGLLDSSFNGDPTSSFILGYIPNLSNQKSSASQSRRSGT
jgi:hypothetical protein